MECPKGKKMDNRGKGTKYGVGKSNTYILVDKSNNTIIYLIN